MSAVRKAAAEALASTIGDAIPDLLTNSKASQDDAEVVETFPSLRVLPRRLTLMPFQEDEVETDDTSEPDFADVALMEIGEYEGTFEVRLYCNSKAQRELLEDEVTQLFLETEGAPGTLPCTMPPLVMKGRQSLHVPSVGCSLDTAEWDEERVFDKKRYSFLAVEVNFPVFIARTDAARMTQILLELQADTFDPPRSDETVQVNQDGSTSLST